MAAYFSYQQLIFFRFLMHSLLSISVAIVPPNQIFHYVNEGELRFESEYLFFDSEYDATYRVVFSCNLLQAWNLLYTLFDARASQTALDIEDECQLQERCGKFGLCEDSQCVGCPAANVVFAWSNDCDSQSPGCTGFTYYQLKGVDHFTVKYTAGTGPVKRSDCESKCSKDCKCMCYFYHTDKSRCWNT